MYKGHADPAIILIRCCHIESCLPQDKLRRSVEDWLCCLTSIRWCP